MDIDETNLTLAIANIQNTFETEHSIPEKDSFRFSKLFSELTTYNGNIDREALTKENILEKFDKAMEKMDDAGVPDEGRILYVTPETNRLLKEAEGLQRIVSAAGTPTVNRSIYSLDNVKIIVVPSARFKTAYDFSNGCIAAASAKQMNFILVHPSCVVARDKYEYIKVYTPGTDSRTADGYIYQNRSYGDLFLLERKVAGCAINVKA